MRILILGGTGFIGQALTARLQLDGHLVHSCDRRVHTGDFTPDLIYYLVSTVTPATAEGRFESALAIETQILSQVLRSFPAHTPIIFASSGGSVYGPSSQPHSETEALHPVSDYGRIKVELENALRNEFDRTQRPVVFLRISNPYGPWPFAKPPFGVINTFIDRAILDQPIHVFGDGEIVRDFIYIDDLTNGLAALATKCFEGLRIYNLGTGAGHAISDVIQEICRHKSVSVRKEEGRKFDIAKNILLIDKMHRDFSWRPNIELEEGIRKTFLWRRLQA